MSKLKKTKLELFKHQKTCAYCNSKMIEIISAGQQECNAIASVDHIKPQSKGGKNDLKNYVLSCKFCNNLKSDKNQFIGFLNPNKTELSDLDYQSLKDFIKNQTQIKIIKSIKMFIESGSIESAISNLNKEKHISNCAGFFNKVYSFIINTIQNIQCIKKQTEQILKYVQRRLEQLLEFTLPNHLSWAKLKIFQISNGQILEKDFIF